MTERDRATYALTEARAAHGKTLERLQAAEDRIATLEAALKRLMAAERVAAKASREALVAARFAGPAQAEAFAAEVAAGQELTAAWGEARAALAGSETAGDVER